ncbi:MAG: tetratricopeptide repeat protein [Candidatus Aminicenantes bacterium]|nr:tetratricopeptide repeat protein [Candidatus Aminicenantes bacterium]
MVSEVNRSKTIDQAERCVKRGKYDDAIEVYRSLLLGGAQDISIRNIISELYIRLKQEKKAVEEYYQIASYYEGRGLYTQAIAIFKKASKLNPGDIDTSMKLADLYSNQGFISEAKAEYINIAKDLRKNNRLKQAIFVYEKIKKIDKKDMRAMLSLSELYSKNGEVEKAVDELNDIAEFKIRNNAIKEAREMLRRASDLKKDHSRTLSNLIELLKRENNKKEALHLINDMLKGDKDNVTALKLMGNIYFEDQNFKKAADVYSKIISLRPKDVEARVKLGRIDISLDKLDQAYELYLPLIESLIKKRRVEKAIGLLGLILSAKKNYLPALEKLAYIYKLKDQKKNLEVVYKVILDEYHNNNGGKESLHVLKELVDLCPEDEALKKEYSLFVEEFGVPEEEEKVGTPLEKEEREEERVEEVVEEERKEEELPIEEKVAEEAAMEMRTEEVPEGLKEVPEVLKEEETAEKLPEEEKVGTPLEEEKKIEEVVEEEKKEEGLPIEEKVAEEAAPEMRTEEAPEGLREEEIAERLAEEEKKLEEALEEEKKEEGLPIEEKVAEEAAPEMRTEEVPEVLKEVPGGLKEEETAEKSPEEEKAVEPPEEEIKAEEVPDDEERKELLRKIEEGSEEMLDTNLVQADVYVEQGLLRLARRILENLRISYPDEPRVEKKLTAICEMSSTVTEEDIMQRVSKATQEESKLFKKGVDSVGGEEDVLASDVHATAEDVAPEVFEERPKISYYDLKDRIDEELEVIESVFELQLKGDGAAAEKDLTDIASEFRKVVEENVDQEDFESRFNLGVAFLEEGLIDEAVDEFKLASRDKNLTIECFSVISNCHIKKRDFEEAIKWKEKAVQYSEEESGQYYALKYELASIHEEQGDAKKALALYNEIHDWNSGYKDVSKKIIDLAKSH